MSFDRNMTAAEVRLQHFDTEIMRNGLADGQGGGDIRDWKRSAEGRSRIACAPSCKSIHTLRTFLTFLGERVRRTGQKGQGARMRTMIDVMTKTSRGDEMERTMEAGDM